MGLLGVHSDGCSRPLIAHSVSKLCRYTPNKPSGEQQSSHRRTDNSRTGSITAWNFDFVRKPSPTFRWCTSWMDKRIAQAGKGFWFTSECSRPLRPLRAAAAKGGIRCRAVVCASVRGKHFLLWTQLQDQRRHCCTGTAALVCSNA